MPPRKTARDEVFEILTRTDLSDVEIQTNDDLGRRKEVRASEEGGWEKRLGPSDFGTRGHMHTHCVPCMLLYICTLVSPPGYSD